MTAKLSAVPPASLPEPPYPRDTRSKGFKFDIDVEQLYSSHTWLLASPEMKPWLLRMWVESWRQIPVGSFEADDKLIAARIEMPLNLFVANKDILLRGWGRCNDGRMYHATVSARAVQIIEYRTSERERKQRFREGQLNKNKNIQVMSQGTPADSKGIQRCPDTTSTSTSTSKKKYIKKNRDIFVKPTLEEVHAYCQKHGYRVDPRFFVDHNDAKGWVVGRGNPMKDWRAVVRTWERNLPPGSSKSEIFKGML